MGLKVALTFPESSHRYPRSRMARAAIILPFLKT